MRSRVWVLGMGNAPIGLIEGWDTRKHNVSFFGGPTWYPLTHSFNPLMLRSDGWGGWMSIPYLRLFFCWIKLYWIQKIVLVKLIISKNFLFATVSQQELQHENSFIRTYLLKFLFFLFFIRGRISSILDITRVEYKSEI